MSDPLRPRLYRPYRKTRVIGGIFVTGMVGLVAVSVWLGMTDPVAIESAPRGMPLPIWFALQAVLLGYTAWVVVVLTGPSSVEITRDEIIKRQPFSRPKRIPLAAITGFVNEGPGWAKVPVLLWRDDKRIRKFALPMYRAEDGTLLREVAPALAETLVRTPGSHGEHLGILPSQP
jgi:hypothetical protein